MCAVLKEQDCASSNCVISVTPQWDLIRVLNHYASTIPFPLDRYTDSTWGTSAESHVVLMMKSLDFGTLRRYIYV